MPTRFEYNLLKSFANWWNHRITLAQAEAYGLIRPRSTSAPAMKKSLDTRSSRATRGKSGTARSRSAGARSGLFRAAGRDEKRFPPITAEEFDRRAEAGEDLSPYFEMERPMNSEQFRRYLQKHGIKAPAGI